MRRNFLSLDKNRKLAVGKGSAIAVCLKKQPNPFLNFLSIRWLFSPTKLFTTELKYLRGLDYVKVGSELGEIVFEVRLVKFIA